MFIVTKYKVFEMGRYIYKPITINFSIDDIKLAQEIENNSSNIINDYELIVRKRLQSKFFDIYKKDSQQIPVAAYDIIRREFILFWSEGKKLNNYLTIKSDNFFDQIERVYYLLYV